jgi:SAM-dependent methyltransferase
MANRLLARIAAGVLEMGMRHPAFGPPPVVYKPSYVGLSEGGVAAATRHEFEDGPAFFDRFEGLVTLADLEGRDVFDLGSGYGGRTLYYAANGRTRWAVGLEIDERMARASLDAAPHLAPGAHVSFVCGVGERLPFADDRFDFVFTYDVFEHVRDLGAVLGECRRVLRPGGRVLALFPPYYGPRAHHLDFITTLPFLHHVFSTDVLVEASNRVVARHPELERTPFAPPAPGGPLPTLNGTTERRFRRLVAESGLEVDDLTLLAFAWGPGGRARRAVHALCRSLAALPWPFTRDVFVGSIRCVLRRPGVEVKTVRE